MKDKEKNKFSLLDKKIWVTGHGGMVGQAILKKLKKIKCRVILCKKDELDLTIQKDVSKWVDKKKPDVIFHAAAVVGGINANIKNPTKFLSDNIYISFNVINAAKIAKVKKLVNLGSSCIYPKNSIQPIKENQLLTGELETTNQWYSIAKISSIKLCEALKIQYDCNFISIMPTNLYGPNDNFSDNNAHVPGALMNRLHIAKINGAPQISVWGTGKPKREFMHVDDLADACLFLAENYNSEKIINVGSNDEISIKKFAQLLKKIIGYRGKLIFDSTKPDGIQRKLLDSKKIYKLGWKPKIQLCEGLKDYYSWYLENINTIRK